MNRISIIAVLVFSLFSISCAKKVRTETIQLPNGREIQVRSIAPWTGKDGTEILMLTYITNISIEDIDSIQREADEIWPWYQTLVEKKGFEAAGIIAANIAKEEFMYNETKNYNFIYTKKANGWKQHDRPVDFEAQPGSGSNS